jgi:hypothetical protein
MSGKEEEKITLDDLEPICLFITRATTKATDDEALGKAVDNLLADFKVFRTVNPFIWLFLGRWKPEISKNSNDRISRLCDSLKSIEDNVLVVVSHLWTNYFLSQQIAWKAWRDLIS